MARRAEKAVLADGGMRANVNPVHAVAIDALAQTSVVAHLQVPWGPYAGRRIGMHGLAQSGAKETQQQTAPRMEQTGRGPIKKEPDYLPNGPGDFVAVRKVMRL